MSNPFVHAERSTRRWGGIVTDYLPLHQWLDASKGHLPDNRHRLLLHHSFGVMLAEQVFGPVIANSEGQRVFVRDLALQHIREDLGFVPTVAECFADVRLRPWMAGSRLVAVNDAQTAAAEESVRIRDPSAYPHNVYYR